MKTDYFFPIIERYILGLFYLPHRAVIVSNLGPWTL